MARRPRGVAVQGSGRVETVPARWGIFWIMVSKPDRRREAMVVWEWDGGRGK